MAEVIEKAQTGSTSDDAKILAADGAPHMTVVWAHRQTGGRGTRERPWIAPEGNVNWSVVLRPTPAWRNVTDIVYVNALAIHMAIAEAIGTPEPLKLKWPNDVLLNDRKLVGTLLETGGEWRGHLPEWMVIGTGINVRNAPEAGDMRYPPTCLKAEGFEASREALIAGLKVHLQRMLGLWLDTSFDHIRALYLARAHRLNETIRVGRSHDKSDYIEGLYRGIDADGNLLLEGKNGGIEHINSAEVLL
jgi:BirA family transcriptional regulator, biotin operon repressor / biotin---[acetyl-CoA-carboxylase] ligase